MEKGHLSPEEDPLGSVAVERAQFSVRLSIGDVKMPLLALDSLYLPTLGSWMPLSVVLRYYGLQEHGELSYAVCDDTNSGLLDRVRQSGCSPGIVNGGAKDAEVSWPSGYKVVIDVFTTSNHGRSWLATRPTDLRQRLLASNQLTFNSR